MTPIRRVAVLGAGVMGAGIAAHLANAGIPCLLFDMPTAGGASPAARSSLAQRGIDGAVKAKPAAFFRASDAQLIQACNYDDHGALLAGCDWIVEVVLERLDVKQKVFAWVAEHRRPGSVVSSNTSGIRLADMAASMPEEMRQHFLITHFFNPVRYMRLLEIVAGPETLPDVVAGMADLMETRLGKGVVYAKDTPNFIANRIGTYGMASVFRYMGQNPMTVEEVDAIFGTVMGRPKSAVFRTVDVVGLDTLAHVFRNLYAYLEQDEEREAFRLPSAVERLVADGRTGQKTGAGFYRKAKGSRDIEAVDLETLTYRPSTKPRFESISRVRKIEDTGARLKALVAQDDAAGRAAWTVTADTLIYAARRLPEIADDVANVDNAMKWGFGWELGPFETWDALGVPETVARLEAEGREVPAWVKDMLAAGRTSFYARDEAGRLTQQPAVGQAIPVARHPRAVLLADLKFQRREIFRNPSASHWDLDEGVLGLEFHSKMNAIDDGIIDAYSAALDRLDAGEFQALVVANQDPRAFCAGANLFMVLIAASQGMFSDIERLIARLQAVMQRAKYASRPVVTAPFGLTLGGGAEVTMHSSATRAGGELYCGLVEVGVGLIPAAGGCKEQLVRMMGDLPQDVDYDPNPFVQKAFERIALAKVSTSVEEARDLGFLRATDGVTLNPDLLLADARRLALGMAQGGYQAPRPRTVKLPGANGRAALELYLYQMQQGGYATPHDVTVGRQLARVLTGGDVPPGTPVTEARLLELEREAFLSLCGEEKTRERIAYMLQNNKPLRN